jgi:hypothetical protein
MKHKIQNLHESVRVYRDRSHKTGKSEALEQIDAYQWFKHNYPEHALDMLHIPNEQKANVQYQSKLNQMGRLKGAPDLLLLHECRGFPYAFFELKRRHTGSLSDDQKAVLNRHAKKGAFVAVCFGAEEFKKAVIDYLQ